MLGERLPRRKMVLKMEVMMKKKKKRAVNLILVGFQILINYTETRSQIRRTMKMMLKIVRMILRMKMKQKQYK